MLAGVALWIQPANGAPLFGRPGFYPVDGSPVGIVAFELNNQLGLDIVTGNEAGADGPSLSFVFNRGAGSFFPDVRREVGSQYILHALTAGDFTSDARADLAVAVTDASEFPVVAKVLVYRNNGQGGFGSGQMFTVGGLFPLCIATADVTGDGNLDLIVCHSQQTGDTLQGFISTMAGRGGGGFMVPIAHPVGTAPSALAVADVDEDGDLDLVVGDSDTRSVSILYGNPTGQLFDAPIALAGVTSPSAIVVTDVDPRSRPDVLITNRSGGQLITLRQTAARVFGAPSVTPLTQVPTDMGAADFDEDGRTDIVVLSLSGGSMELWRGDGVGGFTFAESVGISAAPDRLVIADFNDDDRPDVAASASLADTVSVILNGADPPLTPTPSPSITLTPSRTPTRTPTRSGPTFTPTVTPTPAGPGDANCDGRINRGDIDGVIRQIFDRTCSAADADQDGRVTISDLLRILQLVTSN